MGSTIKKLFETKWKRVHQLQVFKEITKANRETGLMCHKIGR